LQGSGVFAATSSFGDPCGIECFDRYGECIRGQQRDALPFRDAPRESELTSLERKKENAMRYLVLALMAVAVLALAAASVQAEYPYGGYYAPGYAPNYGVQVNNYYGGYNGGWGGGVGWRGSSFADDAARIRAAHSPYRYYTHPRSLYNSPPTQADYFGWEW
jgi:hypothetical protein